MRGRREGSESGEEKEYRRRKDRGELAKTESKEGYLKNGRVKRERRKRERQGVANRASVNS